MLNAEQATNYVINRTRVKVHPATGDDVTLNEGRVVGYCPAPSVVLERDDGTRTWWSCDLPYEEVPVRPEPDHPSRPDVPSPSPPPSRGVSSPPLDRIARESRVRECLRLGDAGEVVRAVADAWGADVRRAEAAHLREADAPPPPSPPPVVPVELTDASARVVGRTIREAAEIVALPIENDRELRAICLRLALDTWNSVFMPKDDDTWAERAGRILAVARRYRDFILGEVEEAPVADLPVVPEPEHEPKTKERP